MKSEAYCCETGQCKPEFPRAAQATLDKVTAVFGQRESEYSDTWNLDNQVTKMLDHVLRITGFGSPSKKQKRLILIAALCDVKDSRLIGEYKADTHLDAIAYRAALAKWLEEYHQC
jgi:hypothetical protein